MDKAKQMVQEIRELAKQDEKYSALLKKLCIMEKKLGEVETTMTNTQRDTMWDFFDLSEEVNQRLLELACQRH